MIPTVSVSVPTTSAATPPASKTTAPPQAQAPRTSAGEPSPANLRPLTTQAIDPVKQSAVALRLPDQEKLDSTVSDVTDENAPAGPAPSFPETILARQARVALDPPEAKDLPGPEPVTPFEKDETLRSTPDVDIAPTLPMTTKKAQAGIAEIREIGAQAPDGTSSIPDGRQTTEARSGTTTG